MRLLRFVLLNSTKNPVFPRWLSHSESGNRVFLVASLLICCLLLIAGCSQAPSPTVPPVVPSAVVPAGAPPPSTRTLPTVYPTPSAFPTATPTDVRPTSTPRPTETPIDFDELAVELRYSIPGLGLERTLRGNISSQIELTDENDGRSVVVRDRPGIMLEIQRSLPEAELAELPAGCDFCVRLEYELFLTGESGSGWLQDPVLLASFENFFAANLGPHFPPDTVVGLRRSATPYDVAHTVALTAGGQLWRWTATEPEPEGPEPGSGTIITLLNELEPAALEEAYEAPCPEGSGVETLFLVVEEVERTVEVACPELALPLPLLPLYLQLDALADEKVADEGLPQPAPTVPLDSVLYFERENGDKLILFADGRATAVSSGGISSTAVLTESLTIDTALAAVDSEAMEPGVVTLVSENTANILIARGLDRVYELTWSNEPPAALEAIVGRLNALLDSLLANPQEESTPTLEPDETPEGEATETPEVEETPEATPTP